MKYGGHETFSIREGWLHKGLKLLTELPEVFMDPYVADHLGVGRNMAKSIRHWLLATQLAEAATNKESDKNINIKPSDFGSLIWKQDPYFLEEGTWWALHINLANNPNYAGSWFWFFNFFNLDRFDKSVCFEAFKRYFQINKQRTPSIKTLDRDLSCLLLSYSKIIPPKQVNPEDSLLSPLIELGLISHFKSSGYYEINRGTKDISPYILGYSIAMAFEDARKGEGTVDLSFQDMARKNGSPGRVLVLNNESLFDLVQRAEKELSVEDMYITGLAGERFLRIQKKSPLTWVEEYYENKKEVEPYAS